MNTASPTQEEIELKPGHALDPLQPLWIANAPTDGIPERLYQMAIAVDRAGNEFDWMDAIDDHISDIQDGIFAWYDLALKSWKIKLFKAWKTQFSSFREFCEQALGVTASSINAKIRAARVVSQLISLGFDRLPQSPSVAHELSKLDWQCLGDTWRDICDRLPDHLITLERVKLIIEDPFEKIRQFKNARVPVEQWDQLKELAKRQHTSPSHLLQEILAQHLGGSQNDDRISTGAEDPETSSIAGLESEFTEGSDIPQADIPDQTGTTTDDGDSDDKSATQPSDLPQHPEQPKNQVLVSNEPRSPDPPPMLAIGQVLPNLWRSP
jgi:hypothetical protein